MRILISTPARRGSSKGNRITALRWAGLLRQLGHQVRLSEGVPPGEFDCLVALHAQKSAPAVAAFRRAHPGAPVIVGLAGTDLYDPANLHSEAAQASLAAAERLVVLQAAALQRLTPEQRRKAAVIHQSSRPALPRRSPPPDHLRVCVLAHLREVKDPLLAAEAARLLPSDSRIEIVHYGEALSEEVGEQARAARSPRYRWEGAIGHREALQALGSSHLLLLSSKMEGGANVVTEAIAAGVPVLSTHIEGSIGLLGPEYPGYFPTGDAAALAKLLRRVETDPALYRELRLRTAALRPLAYPARERAAWRSLLAEVAPAWRERLEVIEAPRTEVSSFAADVARGLSAKPRHLSCAFLYDELGSLLFEAITDLAEYYPTRAERQILTDHAAELAGRVPPETTLFELGSGSGAKTRLIIEAFVRAHGQATYEAVDISSRALADCAAAILPGRPNVRMRARIGTYADGIAALRGGGPKLVMYLGSNIGNMDRDEAAGFLRELGEALGPKDGLLLGVDLRKDPKVLEAAYDDQEGVTAAFNLNLLARANRELEASFDLDGFVHRAVYAEELGRIEMYLVSTRDQRVQIPGLEELSFARDEAIHTESSYKYSEAELEVLAERAGLRTETRWFDRERRFSLALLRTR